MGMCSRSVQKSRRVAFRTYTVQSKPWSLIQGMVTAMFLSCLFCRKCSKAAIGAILRCICGNSDCRARVHYGHVCCLLSPVSRRVLLDAEGIGPDIFDPKPLFDDNCITERLWKTRHWHAFLSFIQGGGLGRYQVRAALTATESNVLGTVVLVCDVKNQIDLLGVDAYDS
jgi:hypothetical protein